MKVKSSFSKTNLKKLAEIKDTLSPYPEWSEFIRSPYCPLTKKEIASVENYRLTLSHHLTAMQFNITPMRVNEIMNRTIRRIKRIGRHYWDWQVFKFLVQSGYKDNMTKKEVQKSLPLYAFNFSTKALNALLSMDCECLSDIVKYRKDELLALRSFGKKSLAEIEAVLEENNLKWS